MKIKKLVLAIAGVALAAGLTARTAAAGARTAAFLIDTRADMLKNVLPESCDYSLDESDSTLTVTFPEGLTGGGPYVLPDDMGPLKFNLNGSAISGTNGVTTAEGAGTDGGPAIVVGAGTELTLVGPGTVVGGDGGDGNPAGNGGAGIVVAEGSKVNVGEGVVVSDGKSGKSASVPVVDDVAVTALAVGNEGVVTLTVEVTFKAEVTPDTLDWLKEKVTVKASDSLATLDEAHAEVPDPVYAEKDAGVTATVKLTVQKFDVSGFYRVDVGE